MLLVKFWLHISDEEQLKRFEAREKDPLKRWKLTDEDWRNREKRAGYEQAVEDMLEHTDHQHGPLARGRGRLEALRPGEGDRDRHRRDRAGDGCSGLRTALLARPIAK